MRLIYCATVKNRLLEIFKIEYPEGAVLPGRLNYRVSMNGVTIGTTQKPEQAKDIYNDTINSIKEV